MPDYELKVPPEVARKLKYYVYLYIDPRTGKPFYVGKGCGKRMLAHRGDTSASRKVALIRELDGGGLEPQIEMLAHGLEDEETAFRIEAAVIDLLGLGDLTNQVRGWKSVQSGRMPLSELITYYAATPVKVSEPAILIRINRLYWHGMPEDNFYDATRGVWKIGPRREKAKYALAVFEGVVREVFSIGAWHPAGATRYLTRTRQEVERSGRWEFVGAKAHDEVRSRYIGRSVDAYLKRGSQNPIAYVNT